MLGVLARGRHLVLSSPLAPHEADTRVEVDVRLVDKEDLMQILGDNYRQARFEFMEKKQYMDMRHDSLTLDVPSHDVSYDRG